jgi:demethylmenaquinone methyltransferase/2-methoxy-6-polyprenyl-1,4-benzoquinol methylase
VDRVIADSQLPQGEEKRVAVAAMFDRIAPRYDRVNRAISLGLDRRWRRRTVESLALPASATVVDLACGTGDLCRDLGARGLRAIGIDLSFPMLAAATVAAPLARADATCLPFPNASVDGAVCGFALRNLISIEQFLAECARVVRPGGRLALLDVSEPTNRLLRVGHAVWFRHVVPRLGARLSGDREAYSYLPRSAAYLPAPSALVALVETAGFHHVERRTMTGGAVQLITGTR